MESMLIYLNQQPSVSYTEGENKKIAEYLTGKIEFESVKPFLKQINYLRNELEACEIGREIAGNRELLPRLGRFMVLMRNITTIDVYFELVFNLFLGGLTFEDMYIHSKLSAAAMLDDVLYGLSSSRHYHHISPELLGFESYPEFFDNVYKKYPNVFKELIDNRNDLGNSVFCGGYLYTHGPAAQNSQFAELILRCGAYLANMSKKENDDPFRAVMTEPYFAKNPYIAELQKWAKEDKNDWNKIDEISKYHIYNMFYFVYTLSPSRSQLLDLINYILIYNVQDRAFNCFFNAHNLLHNESHNERHFFLEFEPIFEQGQYPKDRFLAYFAGTGLFKYKEYREQLYRLALGNEDATFKAAEIGDGRTGTFLMNAFWEKGMYTEKGKTFEKELVGKLLEKNQNAAVENYLLGDDSIAPVALPKVVLNQIYRAAENLALLSEVSTVPARTCIYSVSQKDTSWFYIINEIQTYRGDKTAEDFLDSLDLPIEEKIAALIEAYIELYNEDHKKRVEKQVSRLCGQNTELMEAAFKTASAKGRSFIIETVYKSNPDYKPQWLIDCLADSSKIVRELAIAYLIPQKQLKEQIEPLLNSSKKQVRECAEKLLMAYNGAGSGGGTAGDDFNALAYCVKNIPKNAAKTIAWTEFETLPKVRTAGAETPADDLVVMGYIYLLVTQIEMTLPPAAAQIRKGLNKDDLRALGEQLYHIWKKNGAIAKQRGVLVLSAMDGNDAFILILKSDIQTWADASRGALAADAVRAMALQGGNLALMTVDAISKKFNNKQVQRAGEEAFQFAASQLGVESEVLGDRIVPNLGFDSRGERIIDYGSRSFIATINPSLQIDLKTAEGKAIKSLPSPGANDDQAKASAAKESFSSMKKSLKSVVSIQCIRLELALSNNRTWTKAEWTKLFVENPIMNMFAIGLIWGTYDAEGKLLTSFRYMEDGTFTNVDEDEFELAADAAVGLCHPLDLGDELIARWTQQLSDYEIRQPVEQLGRKVFRLADDQKGADTVTEFGGAVIYAVSLLGKLQKLGWRKGSIQDAGGYYNFYKEDKKQGIGVWLNFSGSYVGVDATEEATVYDALFYKAGKVEYGSYVYDEVKPEDRLKLADIPARLYSEVCYDIERATANRIRTEENWQEAK